jgi:O-antigen/teichoic acid export membrane protein
VSGAGGQRRLVAGIVASQLLQQALAVAAPLVVVPVALGALGPERYGAWLLVSSLLALASFSFGVPQVLVDVVARGRAGGDWAPVARAARQALAVLGALGAVVALAGAVAAPHLGWAVAGATELLAAALVLAGLGLPLAVARGLAEGLQEVRPLNQASSAALVAAAAAAVAGLRWAPSPLWLLLLPASAVATQLAFLVVLRARHAWLRARQAWSGEGLGALLGGGGWFTLVTLAWLVIYSTDVWVVRLTSGLAPVAAYGLVFAVFNVAAEPMAAAVQAIRPVVARLPGGDAAALLRKALRLGAVAGLAVNGAVLLWHRPLLDLWVGPALGSDFRVAALLAGFQVVRAVVTPAAWILVPLEGPRRLGLALAADAALNLGLSLLLGHLLGPWGVAAGSLLGILACSGWYIPASAARVLDVRVAGPWIAWALAGAAPLWIAAAWLRPALADVRAGGDLLGAAAFLATGALVLALLVGVGLEREERAALRGALRLGPRPAGEAR